MSRLGSTPHEFIKTYSGCTVVIDMEVDYDIHRPSPRIYSYYDNLTGPDNKYQAYVPVLFRTPSMITSVTIETEFTDQFGSTASGSSISHYQNRFNFKKGTATIYADANIDDTAVIKGYYVKLPQYLPLEVVQDILKGKPFTISQRAPIVMVHIQHDHEYIYDQIVYALSVDLNGNGQYHDAPCDDVVFNIKKGNMWDKWND